MYFWYFGMFIFKIENIEEYYRKKFLIIFLVLILIVFFSLIKKKFNCNVFSMYFFLKKVFFMDNYDVIKIYLFRNI